MKKILLALAGGLIVYEVVSLANQHEGDTISEVMWEATTTRPLVPFVAGLLCGHFFWQRSAAPTGAPACEAL